MALPINIDDLVHARTIESARIEFKSGWNPEEVIRTVCAFANDIRDLGGGYIIIGIEEKNGVVSLPPKGLNDNQIDPIQKEFVSICYKLRPRIFPAIEPVIFQGKQIIVIWVTTGEERSYSAPSTLGKNAQWKIYVRPASVTIQATPELEAELRELATHRHFDDRINTKANINDFDLGLINSYLQEIKSQLYDEAQKLSLEDLSIKMQIARRQNENVKPINVGLLMFCKNPEIYFEGCLTNVVEFEDESGIKYSEKQFRGPVHVQIRDIMNYFNTNIIKQFTRKDASIAEVERFYNFPYQAIEEAVVNALYHRSYENATPNEIRIYKTGPERRIEILSYPGPLPPIDRDSLIQLKVVARNYRNIRLGEWLKNLRLAEKYATGIPTIIKALNENGSPRPDLVTDDIRSYFLARIRIQPETPQDEGSDYHQEKYISLSNVQQEILEKVIDEPIDRITLSRFFSVNISDDINFLLENGFIKEKEIRKLIVFRSKVYYITTNGIDTLRSSF